MNTPFAEALSSVMLPTVIVIAWLPEMALIINQGLVIWVLDASDDFKECFCDWLVLFFADYFG